MTKRQQSVHAEKPASLLPLTGFLRLSEKVRLLAVRSEGQLEQKQATSVPLPKGILSAACAPLPPLLPSSTDEEKEKQ